MANTIQLFLLENKSIQTKISGLPYSYEGGYNIVAGDQNATEFEIASVPNEYTDYSLSLSMTNSRGQSVLAPDIVNNKFTLPVGMAVAGYGQIVISAHGVNENGDSVTAVFLPLKIKVANTDFNWTSGVINGTIAIGKVVTLPPDSDAYARNVGTATDAVLEFGIPEGKGFVVDKTYSSIADMNAGYDTDGVRLYGFVIINTDNVEEDDNAKLYIKSETGYKFLTDMSGARGIKGEPGQQGVGIADVVPNGVDANGGNVYKFILTDGSSYNITAPKGATGAPGTPGTPGKGIQSTTITYATSTSGTTAPPSGWQSTIPTVAKGSYLWTRTVITYTDGTISTSYSSAYQGKDGTGSVTGVKGANETSYRTGNVNLTAANVGAMGINGDTGSTDLNEITTNGTYYVSPTSANLPGGQAYGQLYVANNYDTVAQIYVTPIEQSVWARAKSGSGWQDWYKLANDSSVVHKSGDTMTGNLTVPNLITQGGIRSSNSQNYIEFSVRYSYSDGKVFGITGDIGNIYDLKRLPPATTTTGQHLISNGSSLSWVTARGDWIASLSSVTTGSKSFSGISSLSNLDSKVNFLIIKAGLSSSGRTEYQYQIVPLSEAYNKYVYIGHDSNYIIIKFGYATSVGYSITAVGGTWTELAIQTLSI